MNLIYYFRSKSSTFDVSALTGAHGHREDWLRLPSGDYIGVFRTKGLEARKLLEAAPGITVMPPLHRPLKAEHAAVLSHVNAKAGEITYDVMERLYEFHDNARWLHPEALDL